METLGAIVFFANAIPHYRRILSDPASHQARPETLIWSLSSIALIQLGYWVLERARPLQLGFVNKPVGLAAMFLARMGFVLATSVFGFVFITQKPGFQMPPSRYVVTIVGLYSLFLYTQELERLGKALLGPAEGRSERNAES